jgi:isoleucyl-tRNA synthetase
MARKELAFPADLYLEGADQHRGWFQLSLLPAVGAYGKAPFKAVLTHGFVQGEDGRPMHKSLGNYVAVDEVLKKFGADIMRLWCSSIDYRSDIPMSYALIERIQAQYRKVRNTFRFLLANLQGFDADKHSVPYEKMEEMDRWVLARLQQINAETIKAYEEFEFHRVFLLTHTFCVSDLSSFYLDVLKDRMYCDPENSQRRRSCQTAMRKILVDLTKLLAPILTYTCEEIWSYLPEKDRTQASVHLTEMPTPDDKLSDAVLLDRWDSFLKVREDVLRELERLREERTIGNSLEASVNLGVQDPTVISLLRSFGEQTLADLFMVSEVNLSESELPNAPRGQNFPALSIHCVQSKHQKCERCWGYRKTTGANAAHPTLCVRCADTVNALGK